MPSPFGSLVAEAREAKGLSKTALGQLVGVSHVHISRIEDGSEPSVGLFRKLVRTLGLDAQVAGGALAQEPIQAGEAA